MGYNNLLRKKSRIPSACVNELRTSVEARKSFVNSCFRGDAEPALDDGLRIFLDITERRMLDHESIAANLIVALGGCQPKSLYLELALQACTEIVRLIKTATAQTTIDDIVKHIYNHFNVPTNSRTTFEVVTRHLVFAVIGWSTMLYTTTFKVTDIGLSTIVESLSIDGSSQHVAIPATDLSKRPIGTLLRSYRLIPVVCPPRAKTSQEPSASLSVPQINFYSLSRLGDVTITWVNNLADHCEFDRYGRNKQLKLFRLPSLCAKICLSENVDSLIDRLCKNHICQYDSCWSPEHTAKTYLTEVLLSYRLLFGQHSLSRGLFSKGERENAKYNGALDPLLDALCSRRDMDNFHGMQHLIRERGVYDAHRHFPHLGPRLMELADYSSSQRPRNLAEVWSDQRDPERLLTFKAVIIIGVVTIILSVLQVFVGILQIAIAIKD
ncbi:hypothetical protein F5Y04DRAFT_291611 [Hypomontagnella monticulosa]|nr:hypothetical protein F5Y04DRAFT_291611 [Hypomontagnella monticulosa]